MTELVLANARVVTRYAVIHGAVQVRDGMITDVSDQAALVPGAIDCDGDYVLPGLVELHTDNLERHVSPRPGVRWPAAAAVVAHDAQIAASGITTVLDALAVGDVIEGSNRLATLTQVAEGLAAMRDAKALRAEHWLHMRCEVSYPGMRDLFAPFVDNALVKLVSLMDHTPGQRQFAKLEKYREYYQGKYAMDDVQMAAFIDQKVADQTAWSAANRAHVVEMCRARGMKLASHDDACADHIDEAASYGSVVAEFPTTLEAARAAQAREIRVMGGAPNFVRGGSHSGNVSARELAEHGLMDILSSDYVPASLLHAAFLLAEGDDTKLPDAVAAVSATPASAVGFDDRGRIATGLRADLIRVTATPALPIVRGVWRGGDRVS
ncbi:MAG: alpha-D-ribose 1-methylphosphonate 5-triphosphate diphosphatase [Alphaproteobacteria bacterium]|nr:alpha-D-ribose 1-methylphosphonate 5-triphosphate diphosphatase [Alphaproteobacteria bacterium]